MKHGIDRCQGLATCGGESNVPTFYLGHYIPKQLVRIPINHKLMSQPEREGSAHYFDLYEMPFSIVIALGVAFMMKESLSTEIRIKILSIPATVF